MIGVGGRQNTAFRALGGFQSKGEALAYFRKVILKNRQAQVKRDLPLGNAHVKGETGGVVRVDDHIADARVTAAQGRQVHIAGRGRAVARKTQGHGHVFFAGGGQFNLVTGFHRAVTLVNGGCADKADNGAVQGVAVGVVISAVIEAVVCGVDDGGDHAGFGGVGRDADLVPADRVDFHGIALVAFRKGVFGQGHLEGDRVFTRRNNHAQVGRQFGEVFAAFRHVVVILPERVQHVRVPAGGAVGIFNGDHHILKHFAFRDDIAVHIAQGQGVSGLARGLANHDIARQMHKRTVQVCHAVLGVVHNHRGLAGRADGGFAAFHLGYGHLVAFPVFGQSVVSDVYRERE